VKSGRARTGADIKASFRVVKAVSVTSVHTKGTSFLRREVRGWLINA
jgi:hypothetical protein